MAAWRPPPGGDEVEVPGRVGGVVPLVKVALDVRRKGAVQCHYLVAERASGVGDGGSSGCR